MARQSHHVVPSKDYGWAIKKSGSQRISDHADTKTEAIKIARGISVNQNTELVIHGRDGHIQRADSHGNDPCPPKDRT